MSPMTYSPFKDQYVDVEQISRSSNSPAQVPMAATEASTHYMSIRSENSLSSQKLVDGKSFIFFWFLFESHDFFQIITVFHNAQSFRLRVVATAARIPINDQSNVNS